MDGSERRKSKRLGANFDISCIEVGSLDKQFQSGRTVNICAGGVYFEINTEKFEIKNNKTYHDTGIFKLEPEWIVERY